MKTAFEIGAGLGGFVTVLAIGFVLFVYPFWKFMSADDYADFCFVQYSSSAYKDQQGTYILTAHIPWGANRTVGGDFKSIEEARNAAQSVNCPLVRP